MKNFQGKIIAITGAGSGIGRALSIAFAELGASLSLNDISDKALQETLSLLKTGTPVYTRIFDVSKEPEMIAFAQETVAHYGHVDVMINNAGVSVSAEYSVTRREDSEWIMGINFWGVVYGASAFLPYLRQRSEAHLVNISSVFGLFPVPGQSWYVASKFAVRGLSESMAVEEKANGTSVTVTTVHPGGIKTNIARATRCNTEEEMRRSIEFGEKFFINTPEYAARTIIKGIRRKSYKVFIGADARAVNLASRFVPSVLRGFISRQYKKLAGGS